MMILLSMRMLFLPAVLLVLGFVSLLMIATRYEFVMLDTEMLALSLV